MARVIGVILDGRQEIIAEVVRDPNLITQGKPLCVRRVLVVSRRASHLKVVPWANVSDPDQPTFIPADKVHGIHTPRKDAITRYKRYWDKRETRKGVNPLLSIQMQEICSFDNPIVVQKPLFSPGNVSAVELIVINHLVRDLQPLACFEIGTFDGRTTLNLACNTRRDCKIYTLDLPASKVDETKYLVEAEERQFIEKSDSGVQFRASYHADKIEQLYGDSARFDFAKYFGTIDFVFVDASHAKEYVLNDADVALKLLRTNVSGQPQGLVVFHDYGEWEGVTEALEDLKAKDNRFTNLIHIHSTTLALLDLRE